MSLKTGVLIPAWLASCLACLGAGHFLGARAMAPRPGTPASPACVTIPSTGYVQISSADGHDLGIFISRESTDSKVLRDVRLDTPTGHVAISFRPKGGFPSHLAVGVVNNEGRDWGLREDGSVEYSTVYTYESTSTIVYGLRSYYDTKGNVERTEKTAERREIRSK